MKGEKVPTHPWPPFDAASGKRCKFGRRRLKLQFEKWPSVDLKYAGQSVA
jgi:hypothetical protein